jgi:para-aminobenzoate synthetase component 1
MDFTDLDRSCLSPTPCIWPSAAGYQYGGHPREWVIANDAADIQGLPNRVAAALAKEPSYATGLIRYEAGFATHNLPASMNTGVNPLAAVAIFSADEVSSISADDIKQFALSIAPFSVDTFTSEIETVSYKEALARIHQYLLAGDCYQVNFARRFSSRFVGAPLRAWHALMQQHPSPHGGFFTLPNGNTVFGVSPERFLSIKGKHVVTEPIKGSRARGKTQKEDDRLAQDLRNSDKDRAENLMIVDLLRNDLGRICVPGSVETTSLFDLRRFSNVQHLVSTITGELNDDINPLSALLSCFPGGSITGAPKKRSMEIIAELETSPRGYYCGTQFSLSSSGTLDSNILIRTFQTEGNNIYCHGGGGIVIDSDPEQEIQESLFKVEALMRTLEGI